MSGSSAFSVAQPNAASFLLAPAVSQTRLSWVVRFILLYVVTITIFGKGPTYLIYPPVYWGELVMLASIGWLIDTRGIFRAFLPWTDSLVLFVWLFILIGLGVTVASLRTYGLDAVRDAAMWYYAAFFFVGAELARKPEVADRVWGILRITWVAALCWGVADILSGLKLSRVGPVLPWNNAPLLSNSHYEIVEHVGLASLIVLNARLSRELLAGWRSFFIPVALVGLACALASHGRGVKLGLILSMVLSMSFQLAGGVRLEISRKLLTGLFTILTFGLILAVCFEQQANDLLKLTNMDRFAEADPSLRKGTSYWRTIWWQKLTREVLENHPIFGLGFGQSLSIYNPFLAGNERDRWPVRSPHNFNMTVFSRVGIAGAICWGLLLMVSFCGIWIRVWRGGGVAGVYTAERREELAFWLMMLVTTWVNSSFGVLMEGPVLGIWFWFGLGFASGRSRSTGAPFRRPPLPVTATQSLQCAVSN